MKTLPSCICILGLAAGTAMGGSSVLMDQIGPNDGSSEVANGGLASQYFEAAFSIYDIAALDDFDNPSGLSGSSLSMVLTFSTGSADLVSGAQINFYSSSDAAGVSLVGDVASEDFVGTPAVNADWAGASTMFDFEGTGFWPLNAGMNYAAAIPVNEFGVNGQTFTSSSNIGDNNCWQANPAGGFGFGAIQVAAANLMYRINGGTGNPCDLPLSETCSGDISGPEGTPDGFVSVDDVLTVIATFGQQGDGTFRPQGDVAPLPTGDCLVSVDDLLAVIEQYGADCRPTGACCFGVDGCTSDVAEDDCSGDYLGDGSSCDACVSGACCLADSSCIQATPEDCSAGIYQGDGTDCADVVCQEAPANNDCSGAIEAFDGVTNIANGSATTTGAPLVDDCTTQAEPQIYNDLYYSYTATCDGVANFSTCDSAAFDTIIALYDACDGAQLACNDDGDGCGNFTSSLDYNMNAGDTVIIRVGSWTDGVTGEGLMTISCTVPSEGACCVDTDCFELLPDDCTAFGGEYQGTDPCDADSCAIVGNTCEDAVEAACGDSVEFDTSNNFDSGYGEPDDTQCSGTYLDWTSSPDIWFTFTADAAGSVDLSLCDAASYDTSMVLYSGSDCGALTQVACNGDASVESGCQSYYSGIYGHPVSAGETLYVRVGGWQGAVGAGTLTITCIGEGAVGACCLRDADGTCVDDQTADDCTALEGNWSANSACADVTCATYIVCDGVGEGPTPESGAWTAGTSDSGGGFLRAGAAAGSSSSSIDVWGLALVYSGGFSACADATEASVTVALHDGSFGTLASSGTSYSDEGISYADIYPLSKWTAALSYTGDFQYVSAQSGSGGQGECWFLWMSADAGTSYLDDGSGAGFVEETFAVAYCITP